MVEAPSSVTLTFEEIKAVTGGYVQPAAQLAELHRQGYYRARRSRITGEVVLERAHYEAVNSGAARPGPRKPEPTLRPA